MLYVESDKQKHNIEILGENINKGDVGLSG